jgi:ketosteroid isomerase-like protein
VLAAIAGLLCAWLLAGSYSRPASGEHFSELDSTLRAAMEAVPSDSSLVHAVAAGIIAADNARDIITVLGFYSDSATLLPPRAPPVSGIDSIQARYQTVFGEWQPAIEGRIDRIEIAADTARVRGHNGGVMRSLTPGVADRLLDDSYLMILRRHGGAWLITRLAWHESPDSLPIL